MTIVYVYSHRHAVSDELRWSLRSLANIRGIVRPLVIGDPPPWYSGPKLVMQQRDGKYADTTAKFIAAATSPLCSDPFITLMDDTIIWSPIELADLSTPRYYRIGAHGRRGGGHGGTVRRTLEKCAALGFPQYDTATHWPYPFEKAKLLETIELFEAQRHAMCLEVAYPNQWGQNCVPVKKDFVYSRRGGHVADHVKVLNYGQLKPQLRAVLAARFPNKSPWENDSVTIGVPPTPRSFLMANDSCVHLGPAIRFVKNRGGGKTPVFKCAKFGECVVAKLSGVSHNCLRCPVRELRMEPVYVEFAR